MPLKLTYPEYKIQGFANTIPNGLKPFGLHPINRGGFHTRRDTRLVATGIKPAAIEKAQRKKHLFLFLPRSRKVTKFPNLYLLRVFAPLQHKIKAQRPEWFNTIRG
ncbi:MAG: hypothetical protein F9K23_06360 [Bacteroidetes bacterium]|nr:MAG: hypothetical protein F9K23_06360 [Bacteroidota bacterium]